MQIIASIVDFRAYRDFARQTIGQSILYFLLIVLVFGCFWLVKPVIQVNRAMRRLATELRQNMPDFTLAGGKLRVDAPMPDYLYRGEDSVVVVDTSGSLDATVLDLYPQGIFVSRHAVYMKRNVMETRKLDFARMANRVVTRADVLDHLGLLHLTAPFILLFGLAYFLIAKSVTVFFVTLVGLVFAGLQRHGLLFEESMKLSIHVLTPAVLFQVLRQLASAIPYAGWIYYAIIFFYLWKAIAELKWEHSLDPETTGL